MRMNTPSENREIHEKNTYMPSQPAEVAAWPTQPRTHASIPAVLVGAAADCALTEAAAARRATATTDFMAVERKLGRAL